MDGEVEDPELQEAIRLSLTDDTRLEVRPLDNEHIVVVMQVVSTLAPNGTLTGGRLKRLIRTLIHVRDSVLPSTRYVDRLFEALVPHMLPPDAGRSDLLGAQYFAHAVLHGHAPEGPIFEREDVMAAGGERLGTILVQNAHTAIAMMQSQEDDVENALLAARSTMGEDLNFSQFKRFIAALVYQRDGSLPLGEKIDKLVTCAALLALPPGSPTSTIVPVPQLIHAILRGHGNSSLLFQDPAVVDAGGRDLDEVLLSNAHKVVDRLEAGTPTWRDAQLQTIISLPENWDPFPDPSQTSLRVPLMVNGIVHKNADDECSKVIERFRETCPRHVLLNIYRIQNAHKWRQHRLLWLEMECRADGIGANEHLLFHGTAAETAQRIERHGFNRSFSNVAAFGKGVYFARDARYSANIRYSVPDPRLRIGVQSMFLARVLVGQSERGCNGLRYPSEIHGLKQRFDSFVDNLASPRVVVSCHHDSQAYPEYLIEFTSPDGWNFDRNAMPTVTPIGRAKQILQQWVQRGYADSFGTLGRLDLSNLDLADADLTALVLDLSSHIAQLRMLVLHNNPRLTQIPPQLVSAPLDCISVGHNVQVPASFTGFVGRT